MKTKRFFLIMFGLCFLMLAQAQTSNEDRFKNDLLRYLRTQGYSPTIDDDGDVNFTHDGENHYVVIQWEDPNYFVIINRAGYTLVGDRGLDRNASILACNEINKDMFAVKLYCTERSVFFRIEQFSRTFEQFRNVLSENLRLLSNADTRFLDHYNDYSDVAQSLNVAPQVGRPSENTAWRPWLQRAISESPRHSWDSGSKYKGQDRANGMGTYLWNTGTMYFGNYKDNQLSGYGIYIMRDGYHFSGYSDANFYVGNFASGDMNGTGNFYDKEGNLVYHGEFRNDKPTGTYPSTGYSSYKFEVLDFSEVNGMYIGETKDGKRHGYGIMVWQNNDIWIGWWSEGSRDGTGLYINSDGSVLTGSWQGDTRTADTQPAPPSPAPSTYPSITIVNETGYSIWYVYISRSIDTTWGDDWLNSDETLPTGSSRTFRLKYPLSDVSQYDIRVVDLDDDSYTKMNVTITNNARIIFRIGDIDPDD